MAESAKPIVVDVLRVWGFLIKRQVRVTKLYTLVTITTKTRHGTGLMLVP